MRKAKWLAFPLALIFPVVIEGVASTIPDSPFEEGRATKEDQQRKKANGGILAIFAHPDDETWIGPLMVRYARSGIQVNLAIVTSGDKGTTSHANIPAGAALAAVREEEARAACRAYGIPDPFFLREQDGQLASMTRSQEIISKLREIIREVKPTVVITYGPDGFTGHPDHRAVSNLVTEVFQSIDRSEELPKKLYYYAYPSNKLSAAVPAYYEELRGLDEFLVTTIVPAKDGLAATAVAQQAYVSQFTPQEINGRNQIREKALNGNVHLRLAISRVRKLAKKEKDVFERIR